MFDTNRGIPKMDLPKRELFQGQKVHNSQAPTQPSKKGRGACMIVVFNVKCEKNEIIVITKE